VARDFWGVSGADDDRVCHQVPIIEESQKLKIAAYLARAGRKVTIRDRSNIVLAVQQQYGCLFTYEEEVGDDISPELAKQPHATAMSSTAQGSRDSYGVQRVP